MILAMRVSAVAEFMEQLKNAPSAALLLDYDGTLAPFHIDRFQARPYSGVLSLLQKIADSGKTRVAIITGRPLFELKALLEPLRNVEMWGVHGLERLLPNGCYGELPIDRKCVALLSQAKGQIVQAGLSALAEIKPGGIAMHWRGMPTHEADYTAVMIRETWKPFADTPLLRLLEFEQGVELRVAHPDKGDAVATIVEESEPQAQIAYLGDDFTDEDAFRALDGRGLTVLVRPEYRETLARAWLKPPEELCGFLKDWLDHAG
ncbi:MAG: trehalose-phosphatase [Terracidiphilus sp.]